MAVYQYEETISKVAITIAISDLQRDMHVKLPDTVVCLIGFSSNFMGCVSVSHFAPSSHRNGETLVDLNSEGNEQEDICL